MSAVRRMPHLGLPPGFQRAYRRTLADPAGKKTWDVAVDGCTVTTLAGTPGRGRRTERIFPSPDAALDFAENQGMARLRKDMVLLDSAAAAGEPMLHRSVGRGYTGSLPVSGGGAQILTTDSNNVLVAVDPATGDIEEAWTPPSDRIIWQVLGRGAGGGPIVRIDDAIHVLGAGGRQAHLGSRIADATAAGGLLLVAAHDPAVLSLERIADGAAIEHVQVEPELYGGHTPMLCVALSADGSVFAWCDGQGSVRARRIGGTETKTVAVPPGLVDSIALGPDGSTLYALIIADAATRLVARDTRTGAAPPGWTDVNGARIDFALGNGCIAVLRDAVVSIHADNGGEVLLVFPLDHVVRRAGLSWHGSDLAVRTDAGCLSLYRVGQAI